MAARVTFSPANLSFASQPVGTISGPQTVTLTNSGRTALTISSIAASGDFAQTNDCPVAPASLAVTAQCNFTITFMPTSTDVRRGSVTIVDDAPGSPHSIALSGLGADYSISLSPTSATIDAGKTATFTLTVTPAGGFSQLISLSCQGAPQASKCEISPSSVTPNGTGPATATVTVTTSARSVTAPRLRVAPPPFGSHKGLPMLLGLLALMMLTLLVARRRAWAALSVTLFLGMLWVACGGGGEAQIPPPTGTPAGSYTLTITATSGTLSHSTALRLTVN